MRTENTGRPSRGLPRLGAGLMALALGASVVLPLHAEVSAPREVVADWRLQDKLGQGRSFREALDAAVKELGPEAAELNAATTALAGAAASDSRWEQLYLRACQQRRAKRLRTVLARCPRIIFTRHYDLGGSHYAYTEGQSDAQNERHFVPGASLCLLTMDGLYGRDEKLLADAGGVIRDPDVSFDGRHVLFAWKKSLDEDDYHLYEMDIATRKVRQVTSGLGFADYEGAYVSDRDIIFNSTRCVQTVDCWWTEVSNLYACDRDGRFLRRLTFDQVHDNFPTVTPDGRVLYTRWEYNDRGQIYVQGLFQMLVDGTGQSECYGNNSWFPTAILHARSIPGTGKIVAVFSGHHTIQKGWLGILDPSRGRQENAGARLVAPARETEAVQVDAYGQSGDQFQYPYPLGETEFLVTFKPEGPERPFAIYWMDVDGRRELLVADAEVSCNQPVPLVPRPLPHARPSQVDYRKTDGLYYLQDIYRGPGLQGVARGTVKKLRVVGLDFRAAGIGENRSEGPGGAALASTPVSTGNGAWDPKIVLGEATVHADGSALFAVPARTPVYFQALDERGHVVQTMRSWSTLQPGERASCVGCHESKNSSPPVSTGSTALAGEPERLAGLYEAPGGFSFPREVQPILDRHCIRCHHQKPPAEWNGVPRAGRDPGDGSRDVEAFSLLSREVFDTSAKRRWSEAYLMLTNSRPDSIVGGPVTFTGKSGDLVNWVGAQSAPPMLPPYAAGAARSRLMTLLQDRHAGVNLSKEELRTIACWIDLLVPFCGDYTEAHAWTDEERAKYDRFLSKRRRMEEVERRNIEDLIRAQTRQAAGSAVGR